MVRHAYDDEEQLIPASTEEDVAELGADGEGAYVSANGVAREASTPTSITSLSSVSVDDDDGIAFRAPTAPDHPCIKYLPPLVRIAISRRGRQQAKKIMKYLVPLVLFFLTTHLARFQTVLITGHLLGAVELDAVALAMSYTNVAGLSIIIGLITACETLFSQAFGSVNKKRVGVIMQQGVCIMTLVILPLSIIFFNAERFMLAFGQNPEVARLAGIFSTYNYFTLFPYMIYSLGTRYLICQGMMYPLVLFGVVGNLVTCGANFFCVQYLQLGVQGVSIGYMVGMISYPFVSWIYIWRRKLYVETWDGLSWECLYDWKSFIVLAISGLLMVCIEWWTYEIVLLLSGVLGDLAISVNIVVYQLFVITFMIPLSVGIAVSVVVGNCLGAGQPETARCTSYVGLCLNTVMAIFVCLLYWLTRNYAAFIFSTCTSVAEGFASLMAFLCIAVFNDYLKAMYGGILRGVGKQRVGAAMNFVSYYLVALPIGIPLAFLTVLNYKGLWVGMGIGTSVQLFIAIVVLYRFDWEALSIKAQIRVGVLKPRLLEHISAKRGPGSSLAAGNVALVSFHGVSSTDDGDTSVDIELNVANDITSTDDITGTDDVTTSTDDITEPSSTTDAEANPLSAPAEVMAYRGRPSKRTLLWRLLFVALSLTLCFVGIFLRVFVPLHRPGGEYLATGCPGEFLNSTVTTSTGPPSLVNGTDLLGFAAETRVGGQVGGFFTPETQYRVCAGFA